MTRCSPNWDATILRWSSPALCTLLGPEWSRTLMRLASEPSSSLAICPRPFWDKTTAHSPQAAIARHAVASRRGRGNPSPVAITHENRTKGFQQINGRQKISKMRLYFSFFKAFALSLLATLLQFFFSSNNLLLSRAEACPTRCNNSQPLRGCANAGLRCRQRSRRRGRRQPRT